MLTQKEYIGIVDNKNDDDVVFFYTDGKLAFKIKHDDEYITNSEWILDPTKQWVINLYTPRCMLEELKSISLGIVPDSLKVIENVHIFEDRWMMRSVLTRSFNMWAAVDLEWTEKLADLIPIGKCLEICAGEGWLSQALEYHGVDIISTNEPSKRANKKAFNVEEIDALDAIKKYINSITSIVCSWPPYSPDNVGVLSEVVQWIKENNRKDIEIFYIGESEGGCTDSKCLWENVEIKAAYYIPNWGCVHDQLFVLNVV